MKRSSRRLIKQGHAPVEAASAPLPLQPPLENIEVEPTPEPERTAKSGPERVAMPDLAAVSSSPLWHYLVIAAIPGILTAINPNWMFQNGVHQDAWIYFGHFLHFPRFHNLVHDYMGERMAWIAPGYLLSHVFGQMPGILILHYLTYWACLYAFHYVAGRLTDRSTALLATLLFGSNSFFISTNAWDYPEALSIFFLLLSIALVLRPGAASSAKLLVASGMAWMAVVYTYLAWAAFTPMYLYVVYRLVRGEEAPSRTIVRICRFTAAGACATTVLFWITFAVMGGQGFFFRNNLMQGLGLMNLQHNPWIDYPDWYLRCTWLVFPIVAFCLAAVLLLSKRMRSASGVDGFARPMVWFYAGSFLVMVIYTVRQNRFFAFDFRTSILLPGLFLLLTFIVFKIPVRLSPALFYGVCVIAPAICAAPLSSVYLYEHLPEWSVVIPAAVALVIVGCLRMGNRSSVWLWCASILLFSGVSYAILPPSKSGAWRFREKRYDLSERVSRGVNIIDGRVPMGALPAIWFNWDEPRMRLDADGVMSSLLANTESMAAFPKADKTYAAGRRIFILTEQKDVAESASYLLARKQMPARLVSQDKVEFGDFSYWITQLEVLPLTTQNLRAGFVLQSETGISPIAQSSAADDVGSVLFRNKSFVPAEPGIYQFEIRTPATMDATAFGALSSDGKWLEQSSSPISDGSETLRFFRMAVEKGQPIQLALQVKGDSSGVGPAAVKVAVLRSSGPNATPAFEYLCPNLLDAGLIQNGGFEGGPARWEAHAGTLRSANDCVRGLCVEFAAQPGSGSYLIQWDASKLSIGHEYEFTAWLRSRSRDPQKVIVGIWDLYASQWITRQEVAAPSEWTEYRQRFTARTDHKISIQFAKSTPNAGTFQVDEVSINEIR